MTEHDDHWAEKLIFDENLKEFAHRIGIIVSLEQGKKITSQDAYRQIKKLWKSLKASKKNLQIGGSDSDKKS